MRDYYIKIILVNSYLFDKLRARADNDNCCF